MRKMTHGRRRANQRRLKEHLRAQGVRLGTGAKEGAKRAKEKAGLRRLGMDRRGVMYVSPTMRSRRLEPAPSTTPVAALDLDEAKLGILERKRIKTVGQLSQWSADTLASFKGLTEQDVELIRTGLAKLGYSLKGEGRSQRQTA